MSIMDYILLSDHEKIVKDYQSLLTELMNKIDSMAIDMVKQELSVKILRQKLSQLVENTGSIKS